MNSHHWDQFIELFKDYVSTGFRTDRAESEEPRKRIQESLSDIAEEIMECSRCALHSNRKKAVPGEGSQSPTVMVIGEGPGVQEDRTGKPFVGPAGQYLDRWLKAVAFGNPQVTLDRKSNTYITNLVKCRPPGNRDPLPEESQSCLMYLERQIKILKPQVILTVSRFAAQTLTGMNAGIGSLRGKTYEYQGIPLIPTYHPSAVLRDPGLRAPVWEDLKRLKALLDSA